MQGGTGWGGEGPPCLGAPPPWPPPPLGAKPCPPSPSEHPGCSIGQEGGREGRRSPWSERSPQPGLGQGAEVGKTPSWDPRARLATEPGLGVGVMNRGGVVINQKKNKIIK